MLPGRRRARDYLILALVLLGWDSAVGARIDPAMCGPLFQDPRCREDCGSCGTPCCVLEWELAISLKSFVDQVQAMVAASSGGRSNEGGLGVMILDPTDPNLPSEFCAMKGIGAPDDPTLGDCILLKGLMYPPGDRMLKQVDEVSFSVYRVTDTSIKVRAFSKTQMVTAHCDEGRNYQNLEGLLHRLGLLRYQQTTLFGCPQA